MQTKRELQQRETGSKSDDAACIMVVGAGRGPLVRASASSGYAGPECAYIRRGEKPKCCHHSKAHGPGRVFVERPCDYSSR